MVAATKGTSVPTSVPTGVTMSPAAPMPTVRPSMSATITVPTSSTVTAVTTTVPAGMPIAVALCGSWVGDYRHSETECECSQTSNQRGSKSGHACHMINSCRYDDRLRMAASADATTATEAKVNGE
jgi:hypothetical protein